MKGVGCKMKMMDRRLDTVLNRIKGSGLPADKQAALTEKAISAYLGGGAQTEAPQKTDPQRLDAAKAGTAAIRDAVNAGVISPGTGEQLAKSTLQRALFASSAETVPGTIEAQNLLDSGKDVEFQNAAFRFTTGTQPAPFTKNILVQIEVVNRVHPADGVDGYQLVIEPGGVVFNSGKSTIVNLLCRFYEF